MRDTRVRTIALDQAGGRVRVESVPAPRAGHGTVTVRVVCSAMSPGTERSKVELAAASSQPIEIAPWCCPRVTSAESALLTAFTRCEAEPRAAEKLLADLLGTRDAQGVLAVVQTLAFTFRDLGLPIAVVV